MQKIRVKLLAWYHKNKRDLPWRRTNDPYAIWISEVMLQQTRVETVIPYYEKFIKKYHTLQKLAAADPQDVLKSWEGLGYYSRARNMLSAANEVVQNYGGTLPKTSQELKELKGFGPYTSASVASIAFGEPIACVDGNVKRVVSRLFAKNECLEETAQELLFRDDPSSFNQAMMELGALICIPKAPKCLICPVMNLCKAKKENRVEEFPVRQAKKAPKPIHAVSFLAWNKNKVFIVKRGDQGRFAGLYEFPSFEFHTEKEASTLAIQSLKTTFGIEMETTKKIGAFQHHLTHRTYNMTALEGVIQTKKVIKKGGQWVTKEQLEKLPFSRLQQRVAELAFT